MRRLPVLLTCLLIVTVAAGGSPAASQARSPGGTGGTGVHTAGAAGPAASQSGSPAHATRGPGPVASRVAFSDWPTYHGTDTRTGRAGAAVPTPLHQQWRAHLRGAVYGEPIVVGRMLIVATEQDFVFGLSARTGRHLWRVRVGTPAPKSSLPCGDINPEGITGTPAYDAATGSVFVVAETVGGHHTLWALKATTGKKRWHRNLDVLPNRNRLAEQERSALLVTGGRVITTFGGLAGDCDNYVGYVTSVPVDGHGRTHHYAVPTAREAGMWSTAGPVTGPSGNVYVSSGNGAELHGRWDRSDSVTELTPTVLRTVAIFAPSTWRQDNTEDLDLGSSSPVVVPKVHRIVIAGKRGTVYLLRPGLGGVGGQLATRGGCQAFGGAARVGRTVLMPCRGENSIRALRVHRGSMHWTWTAPDLYGCPVTAGTRVYVADANTGDLVVLRLRTGAVVQRIHAGRLVHMPSEVVDGAMVFVPTFKGVTAFAGS